MDSNSCTHCGGSGYIMPSLSYGDTNYGNPDYEGEPCPHCNEVSRIASSTSDNSAGGTIVTIATLIVALIIVGHSVWQTVTGKINSPFTGGAANTIAWFFVIVMGLGLLVVGGVNLHLLIKFKFQNRRTKKW